MKQSMEVEVDGNAEVAMGIYSENIKLPPLRL